MGYGKTIILSATCDKLVAEKEVNELTEESQDEKDLEWLAMLPHSWGKSERKEDAFRNALVHWNEYGMEKDTITLWTAQVEPESLEITAHGEVYSDTIENEESVDIEPNDLKKFKDISDDVVCVLESLMYSGKIKLDFPRSDLDKIL